MPKHNRSFWLEKFAANRERDAEVERALAERGFEVLAIWECEIEDLDSLRGRLARSLHDRLP